MIIREDEDIAQRLLHDYNVTTASDEISLISILTYVFLRQHSEIILDNPSLSARKLDYLKLMEEEDITQHLLLQQNKLEVICS